MDKLSSQSYLTSNVCVQGNTEIFVGVSATVFAKHGCKGMYNLGEQETETREETVNADEIPDEIQRRYGPYNPAGERETFPFDDNVVTRNIRKGEQLLINTLDMTTNCQTCWASTVKSAKRWCSQSKSTGEDS